MDLVQAIILGIVQGLTEFAPISSSAHLVLVPWLFGWQEPGLLFDTVLHLGTLVAVVAVFWRELGIMARDWLWSLVPGKRSTDYSRLGWLLVVGTLPAAILGYLFEDFFKELFSQPITVGVFLLGTAALLTLSEKAGKRERSAEQLTAVNSLLIGIGQAIAIAPGISRSGATMSAGLLLGLSRTESARFSFLLAVPIILGAAASQMKDLVKDAPTQAQGFDSALIIGFLAAAVSGYLCINFLLSYVRRRSFHAFAAYCFILGVGAILLGLLGVK